jgi:hypothetical protein
VSEESDLDLHPDSPARGLEAQPERAADWYLTNRFNLLEILSSGLIAPRTAYRKHYSDLLDRSGDAVVRLHALPALELLDAVTAEGGNNFPVLLELPASPDVTTPVSLSPCLDLSDVLAVYFPAADALKDHEARGYDNVPVPPDGFLRVSTEVFSGGPVTMADVETAVSSAPPAPAVDWRTIDQVRGAASALVQAAAHGVPVEATAEALAGGCSWSLRQALQPGVAVTPIGDLSADDALGLAVHMALGETDPQQSWSPRKFLSRLVKATGGLSPEVTKDIESNLTALRLIVAGEKEFEGFKGGARGLVTAKALLLVLLRPELGRLLDWPRSETRADDETVQLAAAWVGRLRGLTVEGVQFRRPVVDAATAAWACRVAVTGPVALSLPVQVERADGAERLLLDGSVVVEQSARPDAVETWDALAAEERDRLAEALSDALGVQGRTTVVVIEGPFHLEPTDTGVRLVASGPVAVERRVDPAVLRDELVSNPSAHEVLTGLLDGHSGHGHRTS